MQLTSRPATHGFSARLYYGLYMRDPQRGYGCQQGLCTYVGDARLKTHYPHGQMHVVALLVTYMYLVPAYLGYSISRTPIFGSAPLCSVWFCCSESGPKHSARSAIVGNNENPIRPA